MAPLRRPPAAPEGVYDALSAYEPFVRFGSRTDTTPRSALASRTRTDGSGGSLLVPVIGDDDTVTKTYSAYAGPTLSTRVDDVKIDANYRIGYTRVEGPDFVTLGGEAAARDAGKLRQEGKEYLVQDGDVMLFKFNV